MAAAIKLVKDCEATVVKTVFLAEVLGLEGASKLSIPKEDIICMMQLKWIVYGLSCLLN